MEPEPIPEQYIFLKNKDIAAISLDVALLILNEEEPCFSDKRKLRDMIASYPPFLEKLQDITTKINDLGKDVSVFLRTNKF